MTERPNGIDSVSADPSDNPIRGLEDIIPDLESLYFQLHRHPELAFQETRTAAEAAGCAPWASR